MRMRIMRMMTLYQPEISSQGGLRGPGGIEPGPARGGGSNWKVSRFPMVLLPAYSLLKQEQLQLAQLAFVICSRTSGAHGHGRRSQT